MIISFKSIMILRFFKSKSQLRGSGALNEEFAILSRQPQSHFRAVETNLVILP